MYASPQQAKHPLRPDALAAIALLLGGLVAPGCDGAGAARATRDAGTDATSSADATVDAGDAALATAGDDRGPEAGPPRVWLDDPNTPLPERIAELGLYPWPDDLDRTDAQVGAYEPRWPLWSNGSDKRRYVYLPSPVDTHDPTAWTFPEGTAFFKTFFFGTGASRRPVETRVLRKLSGRWEYASYRWEGDASARLLDGSVDVPVEVTQDGATFTHVIPSRLAC